MKVMAIATTGLRRLLRDRSNIFFVFILPLAIILMVGAQFGSGAGPRLAVSAGDGPLASAVVTGLEERGFTVEMVESEEEVVSEVERATVSAGLTLPPDLDAAAGQAGETLEAGFIARPDSSTSLQPVVDAVVREATGPMRVARFVAGETGHEVPELLGVVESIEVPGVEVRTETVGEALFPSGTGQFSVGAAQQLVLFVFLTVLTGSAAIIQSRQLGVTSRMLSTPTSPEMIVVGEASARFLIGIFQGLYIIVFTLVAFGVDWGSIVGALALLITFAAAAAGAAMLLGTLVRNDQQAGGLSVLLGLGMAAIGGCMFPLELFSPTMRRVAHVTPHAWAVDGFAELVYRGGGIADVLTEVAVLAGFALVLLTLSGWRLRRVITS